ncbi:hypothetical protein [Paraburkholderia sacchari]|uniref:hypothetical protein n=1 Tax=Paraburkholderia sacchari TaxID=159450 RepID=UPI0005422C41|nr:hypothetical protein [Paraburkholderia sacchari]NLP64350.1 hypothetical protein [Paraburkholderia sacchari]
MTTITEDRTLTFNELVFVQQSPANAAMLFGHARARDVQRIARKALAEHRAPVDLGVADDGTLHARAASSAPWVV